MMSENQNAVAKRFPTQELAHLELYGKAGKIVCRMGNLSASGALLEVLNAESNLQKEDLARVTIILQSIGKTHVIDCEVIWQKERSIGVRFLKKDELYQKLSNREFSN